MFLIDVPDDVVYKVLQALPPLDILALRKTCHRFRDITSARTVWTSAFRNSEHFLPPGPSSAHSVHDLERLLVRAHRLDSNWESSPGLASIKQNRSFKSKISNIRYLEIYRGRFLAIGGISSFTVYDLDKDCEIFAHHDSNKLTYWFLRRNGVLEDDADLLIPFGHRGNNSSRSLAIWKIEPSGSTTMIHTTVPDGVVTEQSLITVGYGFCLFQQDSSSMLLHVQSQKVYTLPQSESEPRRTPTNGIIMPNHVLLIRNDSTLTHLTHGGKPFEIFALPVETAQEDVPLHRTHCGTLASGFTEPTLVSCDISAGRGSIWLVVLPYDKGICSYRIDLQLDGSATSHFLGHSHPHSDPYVQQVLSLLFDTVFTVSSGSRARGVARTASSPERSLLAMCDVRMGSDGDLLIQSNHIKLPQLIRSDVYTFDGFSGRLCMAIGSEINVLEFA